MFKFKNLKLFLFPLSPIKVFLNIRLMVVLAFLLALRFVLQYLVIYIPTASMDVSIAWTPLMIAGWIFGPIFGFFLGIITDTISYFIKPTGVWFWMYALEEPMIGLFSGIIGFICTLRIKSVINKNALENSFFKQPINKTYKLDLFMQQFFFIAFLILCNFVLFYWLDDTQKFESSSTYNDLFFTYSKYIIIGALFFFFILIEIISIFVYKKNKKNFILCCWILILVLLSSVIFSFILGPITSVAYYEYINGKQSPSFLKYGAIFYLIPRVIKESIKAPIQTILFLTVLPIASNFITKIKNSIRLKWKDNQNNFDTFFEINKKTSNANENNAVLIATSVLVVNNKKIFLYHVIDTNNGKILDAQLNQKENINSYYDLIIKLFSKYGVFKEIVFTGEITFRFKFKIKNILFDNLKNHHVVLKIKKITDSKVVNSFDFTKNLYMYEFYKNKNKLLNDKQMKKIINIYNQSY